MFQWLEANLTGSFYLTLASLATVLLLFQWAVLAVAAMRGAKARGRGMARITAAVALGAWAGLAARNEWELQGLAHLWIGLGVMAVVFIMAVPGEWFRLRRERRRALSDARQAVAREAVVYRRIMPGQPGLVEWQNRGRAVRLMARTAGEQPIEAFTSVRVISCDEQAVVTVEPCTPGRGALWR